MKTMLLIAVIACFFSAGSYAQSIDCRQPHVAGTCPGDNLHTTFLLDPSNSPEGCVTYKKGVTTITACPTTTDNLGNVNYNVEGTYKGNYPLVCTPHETADGMVVVNCRPRCVLMDDPLTGKQWYDCPR